MKSFVLTAKTVKANKLVKEAYNRKDGKVRHQLLTKEPFYSFRATISDRNLLRKPHNEETFQLAFALIMKAGDCTEEDYSLEVEY